MPLDLNQIDDAVRALMMLGLHECDRAWKTFDWDAMNRLHERGLISNPVSKAKSIAFTEEDKSRAEALLSQLFGTRG